MSNSLFTQLYKINKWAYRYYTKKEPVVPEKKVAWISSFVPVELLEALDMAYIYPESYAAVISASGKEQACLEAARASGLSLDCCSYSGCFMGCLLLQQGPRGMPPQPDILIASSNQCNTLPNWWNLMAEQLGVPLCILDYPGETNAGTGTRAYIEQQHRSLIHTLEALCGTKFQEAALEKLLAVSSENVSLWKRIVALLPEYDIPAGLLFDYMAPLIIARCRTDTTVFFKILKEALQGHYVPEAAQTEQPKRLYWAGYPFWYHPDRCINIEGARIVGANYVNWWNLDYSGDTLWETLYRAYNFTVLNQTGETRTAQLLEDLRRTRAEAVFINHNKSCKRDFTSLRVSDCPLPYGVIESDMIDRTFLDRNAVQERLQLLVSML
ncbi:MAG: 2-hydroxyacyl-CoA dehydratase family protein [Treponema sp.]|jgi:benzoyl-CoA reductase/2-hydroxyglutaryl-CoA dehydratase subunit BcrC/BadD/HgdB|nr:2-hydroxyacyl-CoA dehydratase family protein [Treponema sp.]